MFSDGVVDLVEKGVITNRFKKLQTGRMTASFIIGTRRLFDYIDDNPYLVMMAIDYVNKEFNIAQNPKVTAINSCIEVDLIGQVCSDSIGTRVYSGKKENLKTLEIIETQEFQVSNVLSKHVFIIFYNVLILCFRLWRSS